MMDTDPFLFHVLVLAAALSFAALVERIRPDAFPVDRNMLQRWVLGVGFWTITVLAVSAIVPELTSGPALIHARPLVLQFVVLLVSFDLLQAVIHWNLHNWPILWRLHAVHHADARFDTATSLRFHPAENCLRALADAVLFWVLAPDPVALGAALAVVAVWNVFQHARLALPRRVLAPIERLLVTPDVHRIHHALPAHLHDRNFGTVFTLWDRLFGWYRAPDGEPFDTGIAGWKAEDDLVANFIAPMQPLTEEHAEVTRTASGDRPAR